MEKEINDAVVRNSIIAENLRFRSWNAVFVGLYREKYG